ncbi:hypothetical protein V6N13_015025 [Hibiscus sabdariffa]|uniref:FRIGIDA-like protein n=1 Tax=Hibiscus sabdariffa TaxID=183260 RepID=A0ABR2RXP8_9ROSI
MEKLTDLELIELSKVNLRRAMDEIHHRASSLLVLNLRWKDMEDVLDAAQGSIEERLRQVISKEDEIGRKEKSVKDQFEELKAKEEELGRQFRDLELGKKCYEEMLTEVELKRKQLEGLQLREEEFVLKEKAFEKSRRDFELEMKGLERQRTDLECSVKQCEQQLKEVKLMEKMVKDERDEIGLKEKSLEKCWREYESKEKLFGLREKGLEKCLREYELKEQQFGLKESSFQKRCMEFEMKEKALREQCRDLEFSVKQCEKQCEEVKLKEKSLKDRLEEVGLKERDLEKWYELRKEQIELKEKSFQERCTAFDLEEKSFKERCRDLEVVEKGVQKRLEEIKRKEEEFGQKERDLGQRCRDVELSENCLQKGLEDLKLKSSQCEERFLELKLMEESTTTQFKELKEKEEQFRLKVNHFEQRSRDFTMKDTYLEKGHQDLEVEQKHNEEWLREIKLKEKQIEESSVELARKYKLQFEDLEYKVKQYDQRFMELNLKEKLVKDQFEQIEAKEQQLRLKEKQFEQCSKDFELKEKCHSLDFELKEKCLEQRHRELEAKEKHYGECLRKVELREKAIEELSAEHRRKYEQQSSEIEFNVKRCEQRFRDLDLKEKKLVEWSKELESKSLALALHPQNESAGSFSVKCSVDHSSPAHLRFCVNMDGKDLQMFLNERWKEHDSIHTEVAMALLLAADPAKLVLDAMQGFYPPHLRKGDREFEGNVARRSCILLLEQLMKISPEVKPCVRDEAMKLAFDWITKMRVESGHELEVLGFLRLLASFQLAGAFDADELVNFLVFVAQHIQTPELFKALRLGDKIPGFIRKLVEKKQHMEAIRFIYAFEQVKEVPPVPVLKDFLNHSKAEVRTILKKGKMAPKAQDEANTKRIADLRIAVKCIEDHKLESEYLPHNLTILKNLIVSLENISGTRSLASPEANPTLCRSLENTPEGGIKRPREFVTTEIAGNAPVGATANVSSRSSYLALVNLYNADKRFDSKLILSHYRADISSAAPLLKMEELNPWQLQQQDGVKKYNATTGASTVTSAVFPASGPPSSTDPSTPEQQENGSKCPQTALSQLHCNLDGFPLSDLHANPSHRLLQIRKL